MTTPNRNDPCACGSGRKAKNCCLRSNQSVGSRLMVSIPSMDGAPARLASPAEAVQLAQDAHAGGDRARAEQLYNLILASDPENAEALFFTGVLRHQESRYQEALALMLRGIAKLPGVANLHYNLGKLYDDMERYPEAIAEYRLAVEINPKHILAHTNLGLALRELGQWSDALDSLARAVGLQPTSQKLWQNWVSSMNYDPEADLKAIASAHRNFARQFEPPIARFPARIEADESASRPLRVGYVSGDFRQHSVAHFIEPVLAAHDARKVEVFCYYNDTVSDDATRRIQALAPNWRVIAELSDHDAARKVREDRIDILVDLAGHTNRNNLLMFARKPAPVQATWLGYPNTTGLSCMDYRITDALCDPAGVTDALHSEKLVRLPNCFSCFAPPAHSPEVATRSASAGGSIMFGSFNYFIKMNGRVIETWGRILARVAHSRLTLKYRSLNSESIQAVVRSAFAKHGVSSDRLVLLGNDNSQLDHLARYNNIDIALDPFPYNGTTTTCDALWMGVPVVALSGLSHVGRVGASLLTNIGLPQLIAAGMDEYVEVAVDLANDAPRLAQLRGGLRHRMRSSPLMDAPRFTRDLERAYLDMWLANQPQAG